MPQAVCGLGCGPGCGPGLSPYLDALSAAVQLLQLLSWLAKHRPPCGQQMLRLGAMDEVGGMPLWPWCGCSMTVGVAVA